MSFLNWELLRNPLNWIVVWLMLAIVAAGMTLIAPTENKDYIV
jgi:hypothetical protein